MKYPFVAPATGTFDPVEIGQERIFPLHGAYPETGRSIAQQ